ncbi:imidazole glycerol phosphate synthase subunit HisH [Fictibacillus macauensis ZFHKF-1]|uniref:Imidazole glycerol phosphate synthase subunit HisH n=1 Tax=Fictibacillus macauensis ZFHKF-1 TaxID=1196324 RepID=I8UJH1_9BACL|nr:imidazole glycerol phosphate synthase subunit HisH [Fictibacillus macauensis]EIT87015.1 imidazole glycerol phosphate synthase subunit HisH [Fictibacillus macauensis ZFHKF-1]
MIGIIDYGMGNLYSVSAALERLHVPYVCSQDPEVLKTADRLLLPGVGAFGDAMRLLNETGLATFIQNATAQGTPLLGICLGMQLLFEESEEHGVSAGLGLLQGRVVRFPGVDGCGVRYKVPHMGWNTLQIKQASSLVDDSENADVYFVHSYYVKPAHEKTVIASATYGEEKVPAIVSDGRHIFGTQFHPEKSGGTGMRILQNYCMRSRREL